MNLDQLGITMICGEPIGTVLDDKYPQLGYKIHLSRNGKEFWAGPFFLGIGYINLKKQIPPFYLPGEYLQFWYHWQNMPFRNYKDTTLWSKVAERVAKYQKVQPSLEMVMNTLLSDGEAFFRAISFEEWATEYGYDTDSRKAETTYKLCFEIGRKLSRAFTPSEINMMRELVQEC